MVGRVQVANHHVAQAALFPGHQVVLVQDLLDGTRVVGEGRHQFANTLFDAFGDDDFAFAGEQFHGAHLTHVHAYGVGGATGFGFHGREGRCSLGGGDVIRRAVALRHEQLIGIRRHFKHLDAHVVDHLDDVFNLIRIGDILGQVIVDLGVGQVALILATGDEILEPGLLLGGVGHSADTFE